MYNFSEFCKEKQCEHYREWSIQAGKEGMVRCCNLVGMSFYISTFPSDCIHLAEITARAKYEDEKHKVWKKLNEPSDSGKHLVFDIQQNKWVAKSLADIL